MGKLSNWLVLCSLLVSFFCVQAACSRNGDRSNPIQVLPHSPVFATDAPHPLFGCIPINATTARTFHIFNPGTADLAITSVSFVNPFCIYTDPICAAPAFDPQAFTVSAGDLKGVAFTISIQCPYSGAPASGALFFNTAPTISGGNAIEIDGICTDTVSTCCLDTLQCCPSAVIPICFDFSDPNDYDRCVEACCRGTTTPPGCY